MDGASVVLSHLSILLLTLSRGGAVDSLERSMGEIWLFLPDPCSSAWVRGEGPDPDAAARSSLTLSLLLE